MTFLPGRTTGVVGRRLCSAALAVALAACGGLPARPVPYWLPADAGNAVPPLEALLAYHAYAGRLSGEAWAREAQRVKGALRAGEDAACARQAMLASAPAAPSAERAQAGALYERCERDLIRQQSPVVPLVTLLRSAQAEHQRVEERAREAGRRADDLARKLDELKAIERTLLQRTTPGRPR